MFGRFSWGGRQRSGKILQEEWEERALVRQLLRDVRKEHSWDTPLRKAEFVVLDTETTGFNPREDALISIGAIQMAGVSLLEERYFDSLIQAEPLRDIPLKVSELTGIRTSDVIHAPKVSEVIVRFLEWVGDRILIMHHAGHDMAFLNAALWKVSASRFTHRTFDTYDVARWLHSTWNSYRLEDILEQYEIPVVNRHTALGDAMLTAKLWSRFIEEAKTRDVETVGDLYEEVVLSRW